jgi:hypothetical protein
MGAAGRRAAEGLAGLDQYVQRLEQLMDQSLLEAGRRSEKRVGVIPEPT